MRYEKTGTGWGRGDVLYACDAKKGNCTDFHSLFIAMARSQGIPAKFEIGFPLPADKNSGEIAGYHCWAEFLRSATWMGSRWISRKPGNTPRRRTTSLERTTTTVCSSRQGRDLELSPKQAAKPLNYFVYPYVEVAGKEYSNVSLRFPLRMWGARQPHRNEPFASFPVVISSFKSELLRNERVLGHWQGWSPLRSRHKIAFSTAESAASGREKSIFADSLAPCPFGGFIW